MRNFKLILKSLLIVGVLCLSFPAVSYALDDRELQAEMAGANQKKDDTKKEDVKDSGTGASSAIGMSGTCGGKGNVFAIIACKGAQTLNDFRPIVYIIGGFGIIAFAFTAIFGKISFGHLGQIGIGLFLVAMMAPFIAYFTGEKESVTFGTYLGVNYEAIVGTRDFNNKTEVEGVEEKANVTPNGSTNVPKGTGLNPGNQETQPPTGGTGSTVQEIKDLI